MTHTASLPANDHVCADLCASWSPETCQACREAALAYAFEMLSWEVADVRDPWSHKDLLTDIRDTLNTSRLGWLTTEALIVTARV